MTTEREKYCKDELSDTTGTGFLHKNCKWQNGWRPKAGSLDKKQLEFNPQVVVESEAIAWQNIWPRGAGQTMKVGELQI